jgi:hypothetical protein
LALRKKNGSKPFGEKEECNTSSSIDESTEFHFQKDTRFSQKDLPLPHLISTLTTSPSSDTLIEEESQVGVFSQLSRYKPGYSSSSIKLVSADVSPLDFEKIRLIGKGDVGRVYLVVCFFLKNIFCINKNIYI